MRQSRRKPVTSGVAHEIGDDLIHGLASFGGDSFEAPRGLSFDAHDDRYLPAGPCFDRLHVARVDRCQRIIEVAGPGIWVCPGMCGHISLREAYARGQLPPSPWPAATCSGLACARRQTPSIGLADQRPTRDRLLAISTTARVPNDRIPIVEKLLGFIDRPAKSAPKSVVLQTSRSSDAGATPA